MCLCESFCHKSSSHAHACSKSISVHFPIFKMQCEKVIQKHWHAQPYTTNKTTERIQNLSFFFNFNQKNKLLSNFYIILNNFLILHIAGEIFFISVTMILGKNLHIMLTFLLLCRSCILVNTFMWFKFSCPHFRMEKS